MEPSESSLLMTVEDETFVITQNDDDCYDSVDEEECSEDMAEEYRTTSSLDSFEPSSKDVPKPILESSLLESDEQPSSDSMSKEDNSFEVNVKYILNGSGDIKNSMQTDDTDIMYCTMCNEKCNSSHSLAKHHVDKHLSDPYPQSCMICRKIFEDYDYLKRHMRCHFHKRFQCPICFHAFRDKTDVEKHLLSRKHTDDERRVYLHAKKRKSENYEISPTRAAKSLRAATSDECSDDINSHNNNVKSKLDNTMQLISVDTKLNYKSLSGDNCTKGHTCTLCQKMFLGKEMLTLHQRYCVRRESPSELAAEDPLPQGKLKEGLKKTAISEHVVNSFGDRTDSVYQENTCSICQQMFTNIYSFRRHLKSHNRPYCCHVCGKVFRDRRDMVRHMNQRHICDQCQGTFPDQVALRHHKSKFCSGTVLSKSTDTVCDVEVNHLYSSDSVEPTMVDEGDHTDASDHCNKCSMCPRQFNCIKAFKRHLKSHIKPFNCNICGKSFRDKTDVVRHINHHKLKHKCKQCPAILPSVPALIKHMYELCQGSAGAGGAGMSGEFHVDSNQLDFMGINKDSTNLVSEPESLLHQKRMEAVTSEIDSENLSEKLAPVHASFLKEVQLEFMLDASTTSSSGLSEGRSNDEDVHESGLVRMKQTQDMEDHKVDSSELTDICDRVIKHEDTNKNSENGKEVSPPKMEEFQDDPEGQVNTKSRFDMAETCLKSTNKMSSGDDVIKANHSPGSGDSCTPVAGQKTTLAGDVDKSRSDHANSTPFKLERADAPFLQTRDHSSSLNSDWLSQEEGEFDLVLDVVEIKAERKSTSKTQKNQSSGGRKASDCGILPTESSVKTFQTCSSSKQDEAIGDGMGHTFSSWHVPYTACTDEKNKQQTFETVEEKTLEERGGLLENDENLVDQSKLVRFSILDDDEGSSSWGEILKNYSCDLCDLKFTTQSSVNRHKKHKHAVNSWPQNVLYGTQSEQYLDEARGTNADSLAVPELQAGNQDFVGEYSECTDEKNGQQAFTTDNPGTDEERDSDPRYDENLATQSNLVRLSGFDDGNEPIYNQGSGIVKNFKCDLCFLKFTTQSSVNRHKKTKHGVNLPREVLYGIHSEQLHKEANSTNGGGAALSEDQAGTRESGSENFECNICFQMFTSGIDLIKHAQGAHGKDSIQGDEDDELSHARTTTDASSLQDPEPQIPASEEFTMRLDSNGGESIMYNYKMLTSRTELTDGSIPSTAPYGQCKRKELIRRYNCDICFSRFTTQSSVNRHKKTVHGIDLNLSSSIINMPEHGAPSQSGEAVENISEFYKCDMCSEAFTSFSRLVRHKSRIHGVVNV